MLMFLSTVSLALGTSVKCENCLNLGIRYPNSVKVTVDILRVPLFFCSLFKIVYSKQPQKLNRARSVLLL